MAETELTIVLKLLDDASAKIKQSMQGVTAETKKIENASREAGRTLSQEFKDAGKSLRDFRKTLFLVTAAIATVIASVKEAAEYNEEARDSYREFETAIHSLSVMIGQSLAPALDGITTIVKFLRDAIEAAIAGFIKLGTFVVEFFSNLSAGPVQAFKIAMQEANDATDIFLKKVEETRVKVGAGLTFDKLNKQVADLGKITVKQAKDMREGWLATIDALSTLESAMSGAAEMGKGWAKTAAGISLGLAIVNTAEGVTKALATYPYPFSMMVAGLISAAGAVQIATIANQKFHKGGLIKAHNGLAIDEVPIIAQTGEGILSRRGMAALGGAGALNRLNNGYSSTTTVTVNMENVSFRNEDDTNDVLTRLSNLIELKTRSKI